MIADYRSWKFNRREWIEIIGLTIVLTGVIDLVCYRTLWALALSIPTGYVVYRTRKRQKIRQRLDLIYLHFRDLIASMKSSLQSGYSVENAVVDAAAELMKNYGKRDPLVQELIYFRGKLEMNVPIEQLFADLGNRTDLDEIRSFASVLLIAKRTGGNMSEVLSNTWDILCMKIETKREIEGMIASRKYEMTVMSVVPFGIILYVQTAFPSFLDVLYKNVVGIILMTSCLLLYFGAIWLEQKILNIEV